MQKTRVCAFISTLSLSMILLAVFSVVPCNADVTWNIQTVDNKVYTWQMRYPIAVDSNNTAHIAYTNWNKSSIRQLSYHFVMYASWNGSGWSTQKVDEGIAHSLILDANDNPHILYGRSWQPLMYASWTGSKWGIQTVDTDYVTGVGCGVVTLDSFGNPHIAYTDGASIKYAVSDETNWSIQTVAAYEGEIPTSLSFALDKNNTPYILYSSSSYEYRSQPVVINALNLTLAVYQNYSWKIQPLSLPPPISDYENLIIDSKGYPHFICRQRYFVSSENMTTLSTILHVSWNGSAWNAQTVISNVKSESMYLALDANDNPCVCYIDSIYDEAKGDVSFLKYTRWIGTAWDTQTVDTHRFLGKPSLALDSHGNPHISYILNSQTVITNLKYATATGTTQTPSPTPLTPSPTNQTPSPSMLPSPSPTIPEMNPAAVVLTITVITCLLAVVLKNKNSVFRKKRRP
ncbi:MAG: hypothetical protein NWF00_12520 [Candidatus Bathyarchaeota archaeon]|nr:hypothetical protein [Candidatus Bathyarchaeota archaeon]